MTAIGDDEHGHRLEALLGKSGIETLFKRDPRLTTIVKLRVIGRSQQLLRVDFEEEPDHEVLDDMRACLRARAGRSRTQCLFSDYGKGGLTHIPSMIEQARTAGRAGAGRPEGQRLRPLPRRDRDHAEPHRAGAGDRRLVERGAAARARAGAARRRSASTPCC